MFEVDIRLEFDDSIEFSPEVDEQIAAAVYNQMFNFYPPETASIIKKNAILDGNQIKVDGFLATALFTGTPSYDLKKGLLSSPKAKERGNGEKMLTVPVGQDKFATVTSSSKGWIHPGFSKEFFDRLVSSLEEQEILKFTITYEH